MMNASYIYKIIAGTRSNASKKVKSPYSRQLLAMEKLNAYLYKKCPLIRVNLLCGVDTVILPGDKLAQLWFEYDDMLCVS